MQTCPFTTCLATRPHRHGTDVDYQPYQGPVEPQNAPQDALVAQVWPQESIEDRIVRQHPVVLTTSRTQETAGVAITEVEASSW